MPYIRVSTSVKLSDTQKDSIGQMISENIAIIRGKTAEATMIEIQGDITMLKGGERRDCVFVEARLFGAAPDDQKQLLTEVFCTKLSELTGAALGNVYMNILEFDSWGSNGGYKVNRTQTL